MNRIANHILQNIDEVVGRWITLQLDEPWVLLPTSDIIDHLPPVITDLVRAALLDPRNLDVHRTKVRAAAEHGKQRLQAGFEDEMIFREYYGIRNAIWAVVRPEFPDEAGANAMLRLDSAISVALHASLLGYHAEELPGGTDIGARLEAIAAESPLLSWTS